jgi:hypothetical protein
MELVFVTRSTSYFDEPAIDLSIGYAYHHIKSGLLPGEPPTSVLSDCRKIQ